MSNAISKFNQTISKTKQILSENNHTKEKTPSVSSKSHTKYISSNFKDSDAVLPLDYEFKTEPLVSFESNETIFRYKCLQSQGHFPLYPEIKTKSTELILDKRSNIISNEECLKRKISDDGYDSLRFPSKVRKNNHQKKTLEETNTFEKETTSRDDCYASSSLWKHEQINFGEEKFHSCVYCYNLKTSDLNNNICTHKVPVSYKCNPYDYKY